MGFILWVGDFWFGASVGAFVTIFVKAWEERRREIAASEFSRERIDRELQTRKEESGW